MCYITKNNFLVGYIPALYMPKIYLLLWANIAQQTTLLEKKKIRKNVATKLEGGGVKIFIN